MCVGPYEAHPGFWLRCSVLGKNVGWGWHCSMSVSLGLCYSAPRTDATAERLACRVKTPAVCGMRLKHSPKDLRTKNTYRHWISALAVCIAGDKMDIECLSFATQPDNHRASTYWRGRQMRRPWVAFVDYGQNQLSLARMSKASRMSVIANASRSNWNDQHSWPVAAGMTKHTLDCDRRRIDTLATLLHWSARLHHKDFPLVLHGKNNQPSHFR